MLWCLDPARIVDQRDDALRLDDGRNRRGVPDAGMDQRQEDRSQLATGARQEAEAAAGAPSTAASRATPSAQLVPAVFQAVIAVAVDGAPAGAWIGLVKRSPLTATIRAEAATTDGGHR